MMSALVIAVLLAGVVAIPVQAATIFGLVDTGELFASSDLGVSWEARSTLPVSDAIGLVAGQVSTELFLVSRSGSIYFSDDAGVSWVAVGAVMSTDVIGFAMRSDGALLLLTETGTLWESTDGGANFTALDVLAASNFVSLTVDASTDALYALTRTGEALESLDEGVSWTAKGAIITSNAVEIQSHAGALYVITETGDTYRSVNAAIDWTAVGTLSHVHVSGMTCDGEYLITVLEEGEVATSTDGASWTWRGTINQVTVTALATDTPGATGIRGQPVAVRFSLRGPWPNPGPPGSRTLKFTSQQTGYITFALHDLRGRTVAVRRVLVAAGQIEQVLSWDPGHLSPGVYLLNAKSDAGASAEGRWVVVK
jgi:photosystem II stability/assembly factor-like uncharacterized protein